MVTTNHRSFGIKKIFLGSRGGTEDQFKGEL